MNLKICPQCNEKSVVYEEYTRKDGTVKGFIYCLNKKCGYERGIPDINDTKIQSDS